MIKVVSVTLILTFCVIVTAGVIVDLYKTWDRLGWEGLSLKLQIYGLDVLIYIGEAWERLSLGLKIRYHETMIFIQEKWN